jgi:hypothetical protein
MLATRFALIGGLAGLVLVMTTGWLITGYLTHRFQKATPATWRPEGWRQHALAVLWSGIGGAAIGALDGRVAWSHSSPVSALVFAALLWGALAAPVLATIATYVNLHGAVVAGLLLEWFVFAAGVSLACWRWAT